MELSQAQTGCSRFRSFSLADSSREALTEEAIADVLMLQLKRAADAERRHVILEILGSLSESGKTGLTGHRAAMVQSTQVIEGSGPLTQP